jgi:ABC-type glycerol-3-phosphate transport system substrate-binding protein
MNRFRTRNLAALLSVAALVAAGCGSSSSSKSKPAAPQTPSTPSTASTGTTTTASGSQAKFVAQVKPICQAFQAAGQTQGRTVTGAATVIEQFVPKFRAVQPPANLQSAYNQLLDNFTKIAAALKKNDLATAKSFTTQDRALATKLGLRHCTSG